MNSVAGFERGFVQTNNLISAVIENGNIYQVSGGWQSTQKTHIGVSLEEYNKLKETCEGFYNVLLEKGIIEKEKTQEELLQEQVETNKKIKEDLNSVLMVVKSLAQEIYNIKEKQDTNDKENNDIIDAEIKDIVPVVKKNGLKGIFNKNKEQNES